jgi:IclR family acetate operon transcriptional repressor
MVQLERTRADGYAVDDEEYLPGLRCVAAPVYDRHADVVCALSISGLPSRLPEDRLPVLGQLVARAAAEMTRSISGLAAGATR